MWNNITDEDIDRADDEFGMGGEAPNLMKLLAGAVGNQPGQNPTAPVDTEGGADGGQQAH